MSPNKKAPSAKKAAAKKNAGKRASAAGKSATKKAVKSKASPKSGAAKKSTAKRSAVRTAPAAKRSQARKAAVGKRPAAKVVATPVSGRRRRAIFIDVENTSSATALFEVIESLKIDRLSETVEFFAVGNWRVVGQNVGRELAALGAKLVHSAPAPRVRDWSDLWIAVVAGTWIARAAPGDVLEIVSNDRAFDAVGDAAAAEGVIYRRIQHRRGATASDAAEVVTEVDSERTARRRRRRPRRGRGAATPVVAVVATASAPPAPAKVESDAHDIGEAHGASRDQMVAIVEDLARGRSTPWVNLDVLEAALKRLGFQRPPNSPRLVTRLRRLKGFEVDSHGRVRLAEHTAAS